MAAEVPMKIHLHISYRIAYRMEGWHIGLHMMNNTYVRDVLQLYEIKLLSSRSALFSLCFFCGLYLPKATESQHRPAILFSPPFRVGLLIWDPCGPMWADMEPCGPIWTLMGPIWDSYGPIWILMGHIWCPYGPIWARPYGTYMGFIWTHMGRDVKHLALCTGV